MLSLDDIEGHIGEVESVLDFLILNWYLQWSPLESLRVLFYEAKVPFSERYITI